MFIGAKTDASVIQLLVAYPGGRALHLATLTTSQLLKDLLNISIGHLLW